MTRNGLLAALLLLGAASWEVFAPADFKYMFYLALWDYFPGIALVALGIAVVARRR
jgi:hypothetical protein